MKIFRWIVLALSLFFGLYYVGSKIFVSDYQKTTFSATITEPLEKVFPNYADFLAYAKWQPFLSDKNIAKKYYSPYTGLGAQMEFQGTENNELAGLLSIKGVRQNGYLQVDFLEENQTQPIVLTYKFKKISPTATAITYIVNNPPRNLLTDYFTHSRAAEYLESLRTETQALKNYINKRSLRDAFLSNVKFDTILAEENPAAILLGVNSSAKNSEEDITAQLERSHNKVFNYVTMDMAQEEEELGFPVLISSDLKSKTREKSFFYGIAVKNKVELTDNSMHWQNLARSKAYSLYVKGNWSQIVAKINVLTDRIRQEEWIAAPPQIYFLEPPQAGKSWLVKIIVPYS